MLCVGLDALGDDDEKLVFPDYVAPLLGDEC